MNPINLDPRQGWHAAAGLNDQSVRYLLELALAELAIRVDTARFEWEIADAISQRFDDTGFVERLRRERDTMNFAAEVMFDIQQLLETDEPPVPTINPRTEG